MTIENNSKILNRTISYFNKVENNVFEYEVVIRNNNYLNNSSNKSIIKVYPGRISKTKKLLYKNKNISRSKNSSIIPLRQRDKVYLFNLVIDLTKLKEELSLGKIVLSTALSLFIEALAGIGTTVMVSYLSNAVLKSVSSLKHSYALVLYWIHLNEPVTKTVACRKILNDKNINFKDKTKSTIDKIIDDLLAKTLIRKIENKYISNVRVFKICSRLF